MPARLHRKLARIGTSARPAPRLVAPELLPATAPPTTAAIFASHELWLAAHLPALALDALDGGASQDAAEPCAVIERVGSSQYVLAANAAARRAGVRAGTGLATALTLVPQLSVRAREPYRESMLLNELGIRAQRFTPRVSLAPPDGLLLEVRGSLHLFGGPAQLARRFRAECGAAGARTSLALAPTSLAALATARTSGPFAILEESRLIGAVSSLPLRVLRWPPGVLERLAKAGVRSVGEALRLPRAGFARRFGLEQLHSLDRLTGRAPDLRERFEAPERFLARLDFTYELVHHEAIVAALAPLCQDLGRFLERRQCGITGLECRLRHRHARPSRCRLELTAPLADPQRLSALLGERLALLTLPEPVRSCELFSGELLPRALSSDALWQPGEHGGDVSAHSAGTDLVERLRARLGVEAVHGLAIHATHRPEAASRRAELEIVTGRFVRGTVANPLEPAHVRRPVWLLSQPELLSETDGRPRRGGPLRLLGDLERIETGWWEEEGEIARDYYCAVDVHGVRLWIFREREAPHRWFLHGVFG
jgi:protein ImuB